MRAENPSRTKGSIEVVADAHAATGGTISIAGRTIRCALGRGGVRREKSEGDGATPIGTWPIRELLYRPDRQAVPIAAIPSSPLRPDDGWCDAPGHPAYNRRVRHPFPASAERLWRDDRLYDLILVLGYNDDPVEPGRGSAIFLHLAHDDYRATEGCIAVNLSDLHHLLSIVAPNTRVIVRDPG